jgi:hypothetical protein
MHCGEGESYAVSRISSRQKAKGAGKRSLSSNSSLGSGGLQPDLEPLQVKESLPAASCGEDSDESHWPCQRRNKHPHSIYYGYDMGDTVIDPQ